MTIYPAPKPVRVKKPAKRLRASTPMKKRNAKRGGHAFPKNVDEPYRAWIRGLPCISRYLWPRNAKPRVAFFNSMSDLFQEHVPDWFIDRVFAVMAKASRHTFQVLTKRPERMRDYSLARLVGLPLPNVWLGTSVEDQRRADERIPLLLETPAAVRFVSAEPLLGPVTLRTWHTACVDTPWLDWLIIGGESGAGHRPMNVEWAESLAEECAASGIACFVKQDSGSRPGKQGRLSDALWSRKEYPV